MTKLNKMDNEMIDRISNAYLESSIKHMMSNNDIIKVDQEIIELIEPLADYCEDKEIRAIYLAKIRDFMDEIDKLEVTNSRLKQRIDSGYHIEQATRDVILIKKAHEKRKEDY